MEQAATDKQPVAIECVNLSKTYGDIMALNGVSLSVPVGGSLAVLGENGAGKSSLVKLLLGFTFASAGQIRLFGSDDLGAGRLRVGYLPEQPQYERAFTAREYLTYLGRLSGIERGGLARRVTTLLALVSLSNAAERRIATYSKGMSQRVGIAAALLNQPAALIVDEPTSGLDPGGQWEVRAILHRLRDEGITMLLASHQLAEVEDLCDEVAILRRGQVVVSGTVASLLDSGEQVEITVAALPNEVAAQLRASFGEGLTIMGPQLLLPVRQSQPALRQLLAAGVVVVALNPVRRTLEELYLQVSRGSYRQPAAQPTTPSNGQPRFLEPLGKGRSRR